MKCSNMEKKDVMGRSFVHTKTQMHKVSCWLRLNVHYPDVSLEYPAKQTKNAVTVVKRKGMEKTPIYPANSANVKWKLASLKKSNEEWWTYENWVK